MTSFRQQMQESRTHARKLVLESCKVAIGTGWEIRFNANNPEIADSGMGTLPSNKTITSIIANHVPKEFHKSGQVWIEGRFNGADNLYAYTRYDEYHIDAAEWWDVNIPEKLIPGDEDERV